MRRRACWAIPARYVTGYLVTDQEAPAEAHHAWAEVYLDGLGWVGFDPANHICPTERYVRLACGLDAGSAAPISGTRRGGVDEVLDVVVEVQQQSAASNEPGVSDAEGPSQQFEGEAMTYCVAMRLDRGLVFASDTRTNAGFDNVARSPRCTSGRAGRPRARAADGRQSRSRSRW